MFSFVLFLSFISLGLSFKTTILSRHAISSPLISNIQQQQMFNSERKSSLQLSNTDRESSKTSSTVAKLMAMFISITLNTGLLQPSPALADDKIVSQPLFTKRNAELQTYSDIQRGFKIQRPFGFNEFQGAGGGYLVKFASLFDVDENVVIGNSPAGADKGNSITEYGTLDSLGEKLLKKRVGGTLIASSAKETEGIIFYQYEFNNPLDKSLPRPGMILGVWDFIHGFNLHI